MGGVIFKLKFVNGELSHPIKKLRCDRLGINTYEQISSFTFINTYSKKFTRGVTDIIIHKQDRRKDPNYRLRGALKRISTKY